MTDNIVNFDELEIDVKSEDTQAIIEDLKEQIEKSEEERENRIQYTKDWVLGFLESAALTYDTERGVAKCLNTLYSIYPQASDLVDDAVKCSINLKEICQDMKSTAEDLFINAGCGDIIEDFEKRIIPITRDEDSIDGRTLTVGLLEMDIITQVTGPLNELIEFMAASSTGITTLKEELAAQEAKLND